MGRLIKVEDLGCGARCKHYCYINIPAEYMIGLALWIKYEYKQESVLLETYANGEYKAQLVFDFENIVEL